MNELELFAGAGGGILGSMLLGHRTVCAVEYDAYARSVLLARQNDGTFPPFPIWDDVRTFDGKPWRGIVDCISGGFPCQDISAAGKGAGIEGERSGLWKEMARIICEVRPRYAFIENSPMLVTRGLDVVLSDLAAMGFDARWGIVSAADTGAPHKRERIWILAERNRSIPHAEYSRDGWGEQQQESFTKTPIDVADSTNSRIHERRGFDWIGEDVRQLRGNVSNGVSCGRQEEVAVLADSAQLQRDGINDNAGNSVEREQESEFRNDCRAENVPDTNSPQREGMQRAERVTKKHSDSWFSSRWPSEPELGRVANGVANRSNRLKAIGNGQVPRVRAAAWSILTTQQG